MLCKNCHEEFSPSHGNTIYCSDVCYNEHKRNRQTLTNSLIRDWKDGFLSNYKLFQELLPETGRIRIPLHKLMKKGFDQDAFYGTAISRDNVHWHKVDEYLFSISKANNEPTLELYKS